MVGTLPPTYYLIEDRNKIIGRGNSLPEAFLSLNNHYFEITDNGQVKVNGKFTGGPSYSLVGSNIPSYIGLYTKEEALRDWLRHYAPIKLPYKVHKAIKQ